MKFRRITSYNVCYTKLLRHRVSVTGYGVRYPIYPIPEDNEEQAAANRRVEIEILSK